MNYTCPVCGYNELDLPPADFTICPSCGTEFGYHDATTSMEELRQRWIRRGALWTSQVTPRPLNWNPWEQLWRVMDPERTMDAQASEVKVVLTPRNQPVTAFFSTATSNQVFVAA